MNKPRFVFVEDNFMCHACGKNVPCTLEITRDRLQDCERAEPEGCPLGYTNAKWVYICRE